MASMDGVILAAGRSSRAGGFKMELPLGDRTVLQRAVESMSAAADRIVVVAGWQAERVRELLAPYPAVQIVVNDDYQAGMFSSVQAGIAQLHAERFFLLPGDYPAVRSGTYRQLALAEGEIVIPLYGGRKGHPVLLAGKLIPDILSLPRESNLRDYIAGRGYSTVEVEDPGVLLDVDTPADYAALVDRWQRELREDR